MLSFLFRRVLICFFIFLSLEIDEINKNNFKFYIGKLIKIKFSSVRGSMF